MHKVDKTTENLHKLYTNKQIYRNQQTPKHNASGSICRMTSGSKLAN